MFETLQQRENFVIQLKEYIESLYTLEDTQIFVFGSFLTEDYDLETSDIDIGVYSTNEIKMYDIKTSLSIYLDEVGIKHDIVIMYLNKHLWINIPIMTYGKPLTDYAGEELFEYLLEMVQTYGFNPADRFGE